MEYDIRRGDIYYADLSPAVGSEQGGIRPVVIVQNDKGNRHSPTTIVVSITKQNKKNNMPTHVKIYKDSMNGLSSDSVVEAEQFRTIDKSRILSKRVGRLKDSDMDRVAHALRISVPVL